MSLQADRERVYAWMRDEMAVYADGKWTERDKDAERLRDEGFMPGTWWRDFVDQYIHRAAVLGLETPGGRQALLKALVTLFATCVASTECWPDMPAPGYPSGQIENEARCVLSPESHATGS